MYGIHFRSRQAIHSNMNSYHGVSTVVGVRIPVINMNSRQNNVLRCRLSSIGSHFRESKPSSLHLDSVPDKLCVPTRFSQADRPSEMKREAGENPAQGRCCIRRDGQRPSHCHEAGRRLNHRLSRKSEDLPCGLSFGASDQGCRDGDSFLARSRRATRRRSTPPLHPDRCA